MKFTKLFERINRSRSVPGRCSVTDHRRVYNQETVKSIRRLIEDSIGYIDDEIAQGKPIKTDTGKELLFDGDSVDEPEVASPSDYYLNDEPPTITVQPDQIETEESDKQEEQPSDSTPPDETPKTEEVAKEETVKEETVKEETVKEDPPADYFLDDDIYNQCKKGQSDTLGVEFVPDTYESDTEVQEKQVPEDYYLSDEADEVEEANEASETGTTVPEETSQSEVTEETEEAKEIKDDVKDVDVSEQDPNAIKIYNKLIDTIQQMDYDETVDYVDDIVKDPKLKFLLSLGFGGDFADLKLKLKKTTVPARRLVPTQGEIGTEETLKYLIQGKDIDVCFEKSTIVKKPIVTFQGTFIIDGHHRWSQIFVTNPGANLVCIDITGNLSPLSMLKAVQCTIGSNTGKLIRKDIQGQNLYDLSEKEIKKYFEEKLTPEVTENLKKFYDDPVESLMQNVIQLQRNNKPILNAPDRGEMPQTSKDPELFDDLKSGVTEV